MILLLSIAFLEYAFDNTTCVLVKILLWTKTLKVLFGMVWVWHDNYHDIYEIWMIWRPREKCGILGVQVHLQQSPPEINSEKNPWGKCFDFAKLVKHLGPNLFEVFGSMDIRFFDDQIFRQAWEWRDGPFDQQQLSGYVRRRCLTAEHSSVLIIFIGFISRSFSVLLLLFTFSWHLDAEDIELAM